MIRCSKVEVTLGGVLIVGPVDFEATGWTTIIGPNGAGKSTLLRAILGLVPLVGTVEIDGVDAATMSRRELASRMAYVPQNPEIPIGLRLLDYVLLGMTPRLASGAWPGPEHVDEAVDALEAFGLDHFAERYVTSLSGGERQLGLVARAMLQRAEILVLDEPTTALDLGHQQEVLAAVEMLRRERSITVVSTMHDLSLAADYADELILLSDGNIVVSGTADKVLEADTISRYYGANVDVIRHRGRMVVIPTSELS